MPPPDPSTDTLHELETEGLIQLGRRRILLLRPDELVDAVHQRKG